MRRALLLYTLLLVYGSLYPFHWRPPAAPLFTFLRDGVPPAADLAQNILVYIPFGLLVAGWWCARHRYRHAALLAVAAAAALSLAMETAQQWLPARVPSLLDVLCNVGGAALGAVLAAGVRRDTPGGRRLHVWRRRWFHGGPPASVGLATLACWALSHASPLLPATGPEHVRQGVALLLWQLRQPQLANLGLLAAWLGQLAGMGLLLRTLVRARRPFLPPYLLLLASALGARLVVAGRSLPAELALAAALSLPLLAVLLRRPPRVRAWAGLALLALGMAAYELTPLASHWWRPPYFNWVPFRGQMRSLHGFENILEFLWPFMAMACLARGLCPAGRRRLVALAGGAGAVGGVLLLEWLQLYIPGRSADITPVLVAGAGWCAPWLARAARR